MSVTWLSRTVSKAWVLSLVPRFATKTTVSIGQYRVGPLPFRLPPFMERVATELA